MKSEYYATVKNKKIRGINSSHPPRELEVGQFELTYEEFKVLNSLTVYVDQTGIDLQRLQDIVNSIKSKLENAGEYKI